MIKAKIAIGVGVVFAVVESNQVKDIKLSRTNTLVELDDEVYMLYKGETFEESQKVDKLFDTCTVKTFPISSHQVT